MDVWALVIFSLGGISGVFSSQRSYCYNGFSWFVGNCYGLISDPFPAYLAETECNKLPGGHLAVFHTQDEYNYQVDLVMSVFPGGAWSGYVFNETRNTWLFIDGSTVPTGHWICCDLNGIDNDNPAHCARFHGSNLNDRGCGSSLPYVCSHPEWQPSLDFSENLDAFKYQELLDNNNASYINSLEAFNGLGHYVVWLQLSQWLGDFSAAVRFKNPLRCVDRQVLSTWRQHSECDPGGYFMLCTLLTTGNDVTFTCIYACPCLEKGCRIALLDSIADYQNYPSDVCEIELQ